MTSYTDPDYPEKGRSMHIVYCHQVLRWWDRWYWWYSQEPAACRCYRRCHRVVPRVTAPVSRSVPPRDVSFPRSTTCTACTPFHYIGLSATNNFRADLLPQRDYEHRALFVLGSRPEPGASSQLLPMCFPEAVSELGSAGSEQRVSAISQPGWRSISIRSARTRQSAIPWRRMNLKVAALHARSSFSASMTLISATGKGNPNSSFENVTLYMGMGGLANCLGLSSRNVTLGPSSQSPGRNPGLVLIWSFASWSASRLACCASLRWQSNRPRRWTQSVF